LQNFPKVMIGAAWTVKLSPIAQQFLEEVEREATSLRKSPGGRHLAIERVQRRSGMIR
jgi:hypothetical protein